MGDFEKLLEAVWEVPHTPQTFYLGSTLELLNTLYYRFLITNGLIFMIFHQNPLCKPKSGEKCSHDDNQMTSRMMDFTMIL